MNRNKTIFVATLVLAGLLTAGAVAAQAQRADHPWLHGPPSAEQKLAHLDEALGLSDEQALDLLEVLQAAEADREALHARAMEYVQPEACALRQSTEAEILAILTPEQAEMLEQLHQERAARREVRRGKPVLDCPDADG